MTVGVMITSSGDFTLSVNDLSETISASIPTDQPLHVCFRMYSGLCQVSILIFRYDDDIR